MLNWLDSLAAQLLRFVWYAVLPAVPRALWWVLGVAVFSALNLVFEQEVWPHHPGLPKWFMVTLAGCLVSLLWLVAFTAARVAATLTNSLFRWVWRLGSWAGFAGAAFLTVIVAIGVTIFLGERMQE